LTPSKTTCLHAALLELLSASARAEVISTEFFFEQFVAMHNSRSMADVRL
jgi:hypothetical protein